MVHLQARYWPYPLFSHVGAPASTLLTVSSHAGAPTSTLLAVSSLSLLVHLQARRWPYPACCAHICTPPTVSSLPCSHKQGTALSVSSLLSLSVSSLLLLAVFSLLVRIQTRHWLHSAMGSRNVHVTVCIRHAGAHTCMSIAICSLLVHIKARQ
jgi:hypothetical protein